MSGIVGLRNLCSPALFYLILSFISIFTMILQNSYTSPDIYCLGNYSCSANKTVIILISIVYAVFWTWILNIICSAGASYVSWILVLLPFLLFFVGLLYFMFLNM